MAGPKFPPACGACGRKLARAETVGVAYEPCPEHPRTRPIYFLQEGRDGYPAGWPTCSGVGCGKPAMDGKATCGEPACTLSYLVGIRRTHARVG